MKWAGWLFLFAGLAFFPEKGVVAQTTEIGPEIEAGPEIETETEAPAKLPPVPDTSDSRVRRSETMFMGQLIYSPFDLLVPSKYGFSLGWHSSAATTWELEYLRGSFSIPIIIDDLGQMTDQRISLIRRSYFKSNSFNLSYGLSYYDLSARLGSDYLNNVSQGRAPSDQVGVRSLGFNIGFGNKWVIARDFTVGIDWISWSQPVMVLEQDASYLDSSADDERKGKVDDFIRLASYFPRFSFVKIQIGLIF